VSLLENVFNARRAEVLEGSVSIVVNLVLWLVRLIAGLISGSASLIVDAWHGLSDMGTSAVVVASSRIASRPPDRDHPYGHGKATDIASMLMGLMLVGIGAYFALESAISVSRGTAAINYDMVIYAIVTAGVVVPAKVILGYWAKRLGKKHNSMLCIADSAHHVADALITGFVIISLALTYSLRSPYIDRLVAIAIAAIVIYEGMKIIRSSVQKLMDYVPEDIVRSIESIVREIDEVSEVHDIRVRNYGGALFVEFCLHFKERNIPLVKAHEISHKVEEMIKSRLRNVAEVLIHQEPEEGS